MFTVYALHSPGYDKIYIGYTSNLEQRMLSHNKLGHGWTEHFRPWQIVYTEEVDSKKEAMKREKQLKSGGGRRFIWSLINEKKWLVGLLSAGRRTEVRILHPRRLLDKEFRWSPTNG